MQRGEIWIVSLDPAAGHEQRGERRVVILSPAEFNRATNVPLVAPITTGGDFARMRGFTVSLTGLGLTTQGVVRCDQPRVLDLRARGGRPTPARAGRLAAVSAQRAGLRAREGRDDRRQRAGQRQGATHLAAAGRQRGRAKRPEAGPLPAFGAGTDGPTLP